MTDSEEEFAGKIKGYLDQSVAGLKPGVAYRLREMRTAALDRLEGAERTPELVPAGAHGIASMPARQGHGQGRAGTLSVVFVVLLIVSTLFGYQQWTAYRQVKDFEELDAQILSSDLPIDAYLDGGFAAWVKSSTEN